MASKKQPAATKTDAAPLKAGDSAPKSLTEAKLRVMTEVQYIRKRGKMSNSYSFVRDTDVIAALRGPMIENGIALTGPHEIRNRSLVEISTGGGKKMFRADAEILFRLKFAPTGEVEDVWAIGEGADNLDKSSNKCMSAARKYALILSFNLTSGEDPDQFDEEGKFGGGEHGDDGDGKQEPPAKAQSSKPTTVPPKQEKSEPPKSTLPADGKELEKRLREYDGKLAAQNLGKAGDLVAYVIAEGDKAHYNADLSSWSGSQIQFAVDATKAYENMVRTPKPDAPKAEELKTAPAPATEPPKQEQKKEAPTPAPTGTPTTASGPTPEERYTKRIAGMGASATKENLDKFREKYSADKDMSAGQRAELEKCYWQNIARVTGKPAPEVKGVN